jgi:hypothetical protein
LKAIDMKDVVTAVVGTYKRYDLLPRPRSRSALMPIANISPKVTARLRCRVLS